MTPKWMARCPCVDHGVARRTCRACWGRGVVEILEDPSVSQEGEEAVRRHVRASVAKLYANANNLSQLSRPAIK